MIGAVLTVPIAVAAALSGCSREDKAASAAAEFAVMLQQRVTTDAMMRHLTALQAIADTNGGNRSVGTTGYDASVGYVAETLRSRGFEVQTPEFEVHLPFSDDPMLMVDGVDVAAHPLEFTIGTPPGGISGPLVPVPADGTLGCKTADYDGLDVTGAVVLVDRGACPFAEKQAVAAEGGAVALIVADNADEIDMAGTLGKRTDVTIPVISVTKADGARLRSRPGDVTLSLKAGFRTSKTRNVVAQTQTGSTANVVMVGAHLDSVPWGPGINDNGSGVAAVLETALQMGSSPQVNNAVRFAFWGAEEAGLKGSRNYVESLDADQLKNIALYLNFDVLGSPNPGYFVYNGDPSVDSNEQRSVAAEGSAAIERTFTAYLSGAGETSQSATTDGRADDDGFTLAGVPTGGLFSGAEQKKTDEQAELWGGTAGEPFDPNYHKSTDTLQHVDRRALGINGGGVAYGVGLYAQYLAGRNGVPNYAERTRHPRPCTAAGVGQSPTCDCGVAIRNGDPSWTCATRT